MTQWIIKFKTKGTYNNPNIEEKTKSRDPIDKSGIDQSNEFGEEVSEQVEFSDSNIAWTGEVDPELSEFIDPEEEKEWGSDLHLDLNEFMHHQIVFGFPWLLRVGIELFGVGVSVISMISYLQSNFYFFETGFSAGSALANLICLIDYVFHL